MNNYIIDKLNFPEYYIISNYGDKYTQKNIDKIDTILTSNNVEDIILVLIPKNQVFQLSNADSEIFLKNKLNNQLKTKNFLNKYFEKINETLYRKIEKYTTLENKFAKLVNEIQTTFKDTFTHFKHVFPNEKMLNNIQNQQCIDFKVIEQSASNFSEVYPIFKAELDELLKLIQLYIDGICNNIEEKLTTNGNSIEEMKVMLNQNTQKIIYQINQDYSKTKKELIEKISEMDLLISNLEKSYSIIAIPKYFNQETQMIQMEMKKRKTFDIFFQNIMNYIQNTLLMNEEKRRNEFLEKIKVNNKNELYGKFIDLLYKENFMLNINNDELYTNGIISSLLDKINKNFENINNYLYNGNNNISKAENIEKKEQDNNQSNIDIIDELKKILIENCKVPTEELKDYHNIQSLVSLLYERTKSYSDPILNISNTSLACSIFLDDNKGLPSTGNLLKRNSSLSLNLKNIGIEKFVSKYEDIIYFYENLYDYINNYLTRVNSKELSLLNKENPQTLGDAIEKILKENINIKKKYNKLLFSLYKLKK